MHILLSENIKSSLKKVRIYVLNFQCIVDESNPLLWKEIDLFATSLQKTFLLEDVNKIETIAAARNAYKKCGKDPNRYRPSADSLIRRIVKGNSLYKVNSIVDVLNYISIQSGFSIGGYDIDKIDGPVLMDVGNASDFYTGIGRGELNIEGLPVLRDNRGVFGSPTSDSVRTMITLSSKNIAFVYFDFGYSEHLLKFIDLTGKLLTSYATTNSMNNNIF